MMALKKTKPSGVGRRLLGQHQKYGTSVAGRHYSKLLPRTPRLPSPAEFYESVIRGFKASDAQWAWGLCPFHDDRHPSFCMNLESGWYRCHSSNCGATGNSIVGFVCARDGASREEALKHLGGWQ